LQLSCTDFFLPIYLGSLAKKKWSRGNSTFKSIIPKASINRNGVVTVYMACAAICSIVGEGWHLVE
jgi:hypothetical protein